MSLTFMITDENLGAFAADEKTCGRQLEQLRQIVGNMENNEAGLKKAAKLIRAMLAKDPLFLRGYAMLSEMYIDLEDEQRAAEWHVNGCQAALKIIPEDFSGPMDMDNPDVQCFLRCHSGYVDSLTAKGDYPAALAAARRQLVFDPEDMFDRARDLGEMAVMAGATEEAAEILTARAQEDPTAWYSLGYLAFIERDITRTITLLRRAFALAPYTVDFLTGRITAPNVFWEQGPEPPNYHENMAYVELLGGEMWTANQLAREFMEWLSQTSMAMKERAALVAVSEKCMAAQDGEAMKEAVAEREMILAAINEETSASLAAEVDDPETGETMAPWDLYALAQLRMVNREEGGCCDSGDYHDFDDEDDEEGCGCGCGCDGKEK